MEVRFAQPFLESVACGRGSSANLPDEVTREIQMIVFWLEQSTDPGDIAAFVGAKEEGGKEVLQLSGGYRLHYDLEEDLITFTDLLCK
jgi:hypothetical protein